MGNIKLSMLIFSPGCQWMFLVGGGGGVGEQAVLVCVNGDYSKAIELHGKLRDALIR